MIATCRTGWTGTAPLIRTCTTVWRGSGQVIQTCRTGWRSAIPTQATCRTGWTGSGQVTATCRTGWQGWDGQTIIATCRTGWTAEGGQTIRTCRTGWRGWDTDPGPWTPPDPAPPADDVLVTLPGHTLDPVRISISQSRQQAAIEATLELATEADWQLCTRLTPVSLTLWGQTYALLIDSRDRAESFAQTTWSVRLASPVIRLELPIAMPVEGELTGQASEIAAQLATPLAIHWRAVDWRIGPGRWIANRESPLALLQTLATACGAALISQPDGSLAVVPQYAVSTPEWDTATPAAHLNTTDHVISLQISREQRDGINAITVTDQATATDSLRIVEDGGRRNNDTTEILVYQTPWRDDFSVTHRGNPAQATITPLGIVDQQIDDEEIIITDGEGSASLPIYAIVSARYNARNLGTPTYTEDGAITTAVKDDSILLLSYKSRARRYRVRSANLADLLVVAETEDE